MPSPTNPIRKKSKSKYRHGDLKSELTRAALLLIQTRNEVEFTLRELSQKTGVTHAAAYKHFRSKNEILHAIAGQGFELLNEAFVQELKRNDQDVIGLGVAYVRFAIENPAYFRVMFHPDTRTLEPDRGAGTFSMLQKCIEQNQKAGLFSHRPSVELSLACWSLVHGLAVLWTNGSLDPLPSGDVIDPLKTPLMVTTSLVEGLLKR